MQRGGLQRGNSTKALPHPGTLGDTIGESPISEIPF